ncbi:hypothetical protein GCM10009555_064610 [Acrocarpospora macrocephala]|uniref:Uncharacterized protein n=1 Tax=Acrocarpospora macrocephala TaxID=150177 RepID=A0A5M3WER9_9ACTN|nr:hypothetical protein [Acrocarpospora macrocephala]GES07605.1 hypothetical protein Amac_012000 [Acrocarpospora macrocephala]
MTNKINYHSPAIKTPTSLPENTPVLVWYPLSEAVEQDRTAWAWLPGTVLSQCRPDEWHFVVEVPARAVRDGDGPGSLQYPACFRDSTEIHAITEDQWEQARKELARG